VGEGERERERGRGGKMNVLFGVSWNVLGILINEKGTSLEFSQSEFFILFPLSPLSLSPLSP
jgi:hypothetical protein